MTLEAILIKHLDELRDFKYAWGMFLDEFYRTVEKDKQRFLLSKEPNLPSLGFTISCFIAASVHRLSNMNHLEVPEWVFKDRYYSIDPLFIDNPGDLLRLVYLIESPAEFKSRNVFVSANVLSRA